MRIGQKNWKLRAQDDHRVRRLASELEISSIVAHLLINRGIEEPVLARRFLNPVLTELHTPETLPGAARAANLIIRAIRENQRVRIFGDYDADGVTGTAILVRLIEQLGGQVDFHIPHRLDDGYGLNADSVRQAKEDGVKVLVTVDCGITAITEAELARQLGLQLVITDHHEQRDELPAADAIVHPRLPGNYPFGGLSGSGVAFKLAWVIAQLHSESQRVTPELKDHLMDSVGLAALGLVADVVPLRDENRIFVKHGLARIAARPSTGLKALIETCRLKDRTITAEDVGYKLAPRLNAAGRLGCARLVVELLTTRSPVKAREIAECLDGFNTQRQTLERRIAANAREQIKHQGLSTDLGLVLGSEDWHQGVVGIVAGRLTEQFGKPTILVSLRGQDEPSTGSGRSIAGIELHEVLKECAHLLESYGGHAAAAGIKIRPSKIGEFRAAFNEVIARKCPDGLPQPRLMLDSEVPLSALTFGLIREIDRLEPYGAENSKPRFLAADVSIEEGTPKRVGADQSHLNFRVRQGAASFSAVAFGMGERLEELISGHGRCSLAFEPRINEWQGRRSIQIFVIDFQAGSNPIIE